MEIRALTGFIDLDYPLQPGALDTIAAALHKTRETLREAGYHVQSLRLASQPLAEIVAPEELQALAQAFEAQASAQGIAYVALGPLRLDDSPAYLDALPAVFSGLSSVFASAEIATPSAGIDLPRTRAIAALVSRIAHISPDGFKNLYFTASANVAPWAPFFPAAYHGGGAPRLAIAVESPSLVAEAIVGAAEIETARRRLIRLIDDHAGYMTGAAVASLAGSDVQFQGIDFSYAPKPGEADSIGLALELLGLPRFGLAGSLAASAFLTGALEEAQFLRTGFCGLMLPVLEDTRLALRGAEGLLNITELLACSAVCGTGLDTLPLPGDISPEALNAILLDVAALALRGNKPLTARLMPMPGKAAGDPLEFDFEYFAPSRVLRASAEGLFGLLAAEGRLSVPAIRR